MSKDNMGHANKLFHASPVDIQKKLSFQANQPAPIISADLLYSVHDFFNNYRKHLDNKNSPNYTSFPKEFREDVKDKGIRALDAPFSEFSVIRLNKLNADSSYDIPHKEFSKMVKDISEQMHAHLGLTVGFIHLKDSVLGFNTDSYLACYPNKLVSRNDKWNEEPIEFVNSKFFGMAVTMGLIERKALLNPKIIASVNNMAVNGTIEVMKEEGVKPMFNTPLITAFMLNENKLGR